MNDFERGKIEAARLILRVAAGEIFGSGPQPPELLEAMRVVEELRKRPAPITDPEALGFL